jgi:hypothetical protein
LAPESADLYNGPLAADSLPPAYPGCESRRTVLFMQNRFWLQKVADGGMGERFIILLEADAGRETDCSKPMSAPDARTALHKLGTSDAVIESMFDRARNASREDTHA